MLETEESPISNREILRRLDKAEVRMVALALELEKINKQLTQAAGAWLFIKILCSIAIGVAVIYNSVYNYLK